MKLLLAAALFAAAAKPFPDSPRDYVHNEGVISAAEERALSQRLSSLPSQFVVALFQGLEGDNLEEYTNKLFRHWKIGDARKDDGLLFAVYVQDRKWRVEVGYGLEGRIPDSAAGELAREHGVPHFRSGDTAGGVRAVVEALAAVLEGKAPARPPRRRRGGMDLPAFGVFIVLIVVAILWRLLVERLVGRTYGRRPLHRRNGYYYSSGGWGGGGGFSGGGGSSGGGGASGGW